MSPQALEGLGSEQRFACHWLHLAVLEASDELPVVLAIFASSGSDLGLPPSFELVVPERQPCRFGLEWSHTGFSTGLNGF